MTLYLRSTLAAALIRHCQQENPLEACGLLSGWRGTDRPSRLIRMRNADPSPADRFAFDPKDQILIWTDMARRDEDPVAIYHSHPNHAAYPSDRDIHNFHYPNMHYIVVSLRDMSKKPDMRSFRIQRGEVTEEEIYYIDD